MIGHNIQIAGSQCPVRYQLWWSIMWPQLVGRCPRGLSAMQQSNCAHSRTATIELERKKIGRAKKKKKKKKV